MGYNQWNFFHNNFNASIFIETAEFMKERGFLAAGYNYMTLGGIGYANGSTCTPVSSCNITRNSTGFLQVDPARFPGGNAGFAQMTAQIRGMGYKWGSYTEAGTAGCNGAKGSSEGYEEQDAKLFVDEWESEYLMVDSCGVENRPPPHGPPPGSPGGQARWELTRWKELLSTAKKPVLLHDCHNGCASGFGGPTLTARACDPADASQRWLLRSDGSATALISATSGLCAGCGSDPLAVDGRGEDACANTAAYDPGRDPTGGGKLPNASTAPRWGLGMEPCAYGPNGAALNGDPSAAVRTKGPQVFNYSKASGFVFQSTFDGFSMTKGGCLSLVSAQPAAAGAAESQVVLPINGGAGAPPPGQCNTSWDVRKIAAGAGGTGGAGGAGGAVQLAVRKGSKSGGEGKCLAYTAPVPAPNDEWCITNNNMWRSSTDTLQVWSRVMEEVESVATQGAISRPGAWSFPDALEVGTPGGFSLTWEEAKSNVALFAVSSSPLFLGNDPRPGRMQERLVGLLTNPDMVAVNQQYSAHHAFAGGRIKAMFPASELWAKPLDSPRDAAAVVLFNRGGVAVGVDLAAPGEPPYPGRPQFCHDPAAAGYPCGGCFVDTTQPERSPCDDNVTASSGAVGVAVDFADIPAAWLGLAPPGQHGQQVVGAELGDVISCDVYDVYGCSQHKCGVEGAAKGAALGRFAGKWAAVIPPHGSRFLRLSNCSV